MSTLAESPAYELRQDARGQEYKREWEKAGPCFKRAVKKLGLEPDTGEQMSQAIEFNENLASGSYTPDPAKAIDTYIDELVERFGAQHEGLIRRIAEALKKPMEEEIERSRALNIGRVACYLARGETGNLKARIHSLLHAIPRLAAVTGFRSMRSSATACGVSVEWISRGRSEWCERLQIPIPVENSKSEAAIEKYRSKALTDHWRDRKITTTNPTLSCPTKPHLKPITKHRSKS